MNVPFPCARATAQGLPITATQQLTIAVGARLIVVDAFGALYHNHRAGVSTVKAASEFVPHI